MQFIVDRGLARIARKRSESWTEMVAPEDAVAKLRESGTKADIFTFAQQLPDTQPHFDYPMEWDNVAAIRLTDYDTWWNDQINCKTRNMVRKTGKSGLEVRVAPFDDELVAGIKAIYDETPVRQGRNFPHYQKDLETLREEMATFTDRADFIGAYYEGKLVGFAKLVYLENHGGLMQIISMIGYRDKAPNNGVLAKAVELCTQRKLPYLSYSKYSYGNKGEDPLARFKRHNAFEKIEIPRYYIPLTLRGRLVLKLGVHKGIKGLIPRPVTLFLVRLRSRLNNKRAESQSD